MKNYYRFLSVFAFMSRWGVGGVGRGGGEREERGGGRERGEGEGGGREEFEILVICWGFSISFLLCFQEYTFCRWTRIRS